MKRDFNEWLGKFRDSIANYEYYIDFSKVDSSSELGNVINSKMRMGSLGEQYNILIKMMKGAHSIKAVPSDIYDAMVVYYEVNPITVWDN